ncbi:MAG: hypothetical protein IJV60_01425 [Prevotella sp.]|nr:hypothetical protein [Prevotella sp.]
MTTIPSTIELLRQKALAYPNENWNDRLEAIETEFRYMSDFMLGGGKDPQRSALYEELRARLRHISYDLEVRSTLMEMPYVKVWQKELLMRDNSTEMLQSSMLNVVDESQRHQALYHAFMALLTSYHWDKTIQEEWATFLSSQQVDGVIQATLTSALTLSAIEHFDKYKAMCLANIYHDNRKETVRQRAYIGCLLALSRVSGDEMTSVRRLVLDNLTSEGEGRLGNVTEIFMQMNMCANVDKDAREIQNKIMPNIMRNQPFEITDKGFSERKDNGDAYDPEAENANLDSLEKSVNRIINMQKNGSDIFFSGFSQMKRIPFFRKYVNWFVPFYSNHPDLPEEAIQTAKTKFAERITERGPFCESDKYSFVIGLSSAISHIPENARQMMENGELGPLGMHGDDDNMQNPSLLRLLYMQDLYRFYRLCPLAEKMYNPFSELNKCLIGIAAATHISDEEKRDLCVYLIKKDKEMPVRNTVARLLNRFDDKESFDRHYCHAELKLLTNDYPVAITLYNKCLEIKPGNKMCLRSLAKAHYQNGEYDKAASYYDALHTLQPDSLSYILNYCMAMVMAGKAADVVNEMYRMDFEHPDNIDIMNCLTWTLLYAEKAEQAQKTADRMMKIEGAGKTLSVCLNAAYAHLANNDVVKAIDILKAFADNSDDNVRKDIVTLFADSMEEDKALLNKYHIEDAERDIIISQSTRDILKNIKSA